MEYFDVNLDLTEEDIALKEAARKFAMEVIRHSILPAFALGGEVTAGPGMMFDPNAPEAPALGAPFYARWGFSRNQFILLAAMAFFELLIITVLAVIVIADIAF